MVIPKIHQGPSSTKLEQNAAKRNIQTPIRRLSSRRAEPGTLARNRRATYPALLTVRPQDH